MTLRAVAIVAAIAGLVSEPIYAQVAAPKPQVSICEQFLSHLNTRLKLLPFKLEETEVENGNFAIPNVDVDADGFPDQITLFRTGSASIIPPDNSTATLRLSSSGKEFTVDFQGFYLISYGSHVYLVGGTTLSEKGPVETEIHRLGAKGFTRVCAYRCGLTGGCKPTRGKTTARG